MGLQGYSECESALGGEAGEWSTFLILKTPTEMFFLKTISRLHLCNRNGAILRGESNKLIPTMESKVANSKHGP